MFLSKLTRRRTQLSPAQALADLLADGAYDASAAKAARKIQRMQSEIARYRRKAEDAEKAAAAIHVTEHVTPAAAK